MNRRNRNSGPPTLAIRFLEWYCNRAVYEEVRGDLDELWNSSCHASDASQRPPLSERLAFWKEVVLLMRSHTLRNRRSNLNPGFTFMWKNYLHVALRSIRKHKTFSAINYLGLAVGFAATILILLFVRDELSYDRYLKDSDRIYRLVSAQADSDYDGIAKINGPWGIEVAREVPAVESVARFVFFGQALFELGDRREFVSNPAQNALGGFYADSTTFDVFSWNVVAGDPRTALVAPNSLVVTESFAKRWFGDSDPIGKVLRVAGATDFRVTALMEDVPRNAHFRFDFLASMSGYTHPSHDDWTRWNQYYTYLKLTPGADPEAVNAAMPGILAQHVDAEALESADPWLQPLTDIYLRSNFFREIGPMGDLSTVTTFGLLALFILLIAAVNFVNLSTARSSTRAREVGVRKSLGALRSVISRQFVFESVLTAFFAGILAVGMIVLALPTFNGLAGKSFRAIDLLDPAAVLWSLAIVVGIGIAAGIYPAFVLSSFDTVSVMKGNIATRGRVSLRKGLVVLQFAISAALIICTGIVSDQLDYIRTKPLGFDSELVAGIPNQDASLSPKLPTMKERMRSVPGVVDVTLSGNRPGGSDWGIPVEVPGLTRDETPAIRMLVGDADFTDTYGIKIFDGRGFDEVRTTDRENGLLVNEEFVRQVGWQSPIGQRVLMPNVERDFQVIGVVKDFHFRSIHEAIAPMMIFQAPDEWYSMINVRLAPDAGPETMERLSDIYAEFDAVNPMSYSFVNRLYERLYAADDRVAALLRIATALAIVVACMGLFGLAAFTAERRTKEIGIRKVIGASTASIITMLTRETALLAAIAVVPALLASTYFAQQWLSGFAYHVNIKAMTVGIGVLIAVGLAIGTTGLQAWRSARQNPVRSLRTD